MTTMDTPQQQQYHRLVVLRTALDLAGHRAETGGGYSSDPYVKVYVLHSDGRPALTVRMTADRYWWGDSPDSDTTSIDAATNVVHVAAAILRDLYTPIVRAAMLTDSLNRSGQVDAQGRVHNRAIPVVEVFADGAAAALLTTVQTGAGYAWRCPSGSHILAAEADVAAVAQQVIDSCTPGHQH